MVVYNNVLAGAAGAGTSDFKIERSLRFDQASGAYLQKNIGGSATTFTVSCWVKLADLTSLQAIFGFGAANYSDTLFYNGSNNQFSLYDGTSTSHTYSTAVFRDPSAWYHLHVKVSSGQPTLYVNGVETIAASNSSWELYGNFCRIGAFNGAGTAQYSFNGCMADFHCVEGQALDPSSFAETDADTGVYNAIKYSGNYGTNGFHLDFADNSSTTALGYDAAGNNNWSVNNFSVQEYINYTNGTYTVVSGGSILYPDRAFNGSIQNYTIQNGIQSGTNEWTWTPTTPVTGITTLKLYLVRSDASGSASNFQYKINDGNYVDSGVAQNNDALVTISNPPSTLSKLSFKSVISNNSSGLGLSGVQVNGTYLANNDGSGNDSLIDSPTNYEATSGNNGGNYACLNPLANGSGTAPTNGNLDITTTDGSFGDIGSTIAPSSGKFYVEFAIKSDADRAMIGIASNSTFATNTQFHTLSDAWAYYSDGGVLYNNSTSSTFGDAYGPGDVIGIALDKDNDRLYFSKNGTFQNSGNPSAGTGGIDISSVSGKPSFIMVNDVSSAAKTSVAFNAGQRPFATSSVPTGFKSLCTTNLADPTIEKSTDHFDIALYYGDGTSSKAISGFSFSPDLVWTKSRSASHWHILGDTIRGAGPTLGANTNYQEWNDGLYSSFDSNGFTVAQVSTNQSTNGSNTSYVSWAWEGGDLATNSAYNQDRVWSDGVTFSGTILEPATKAFDGNSATSAAPYDASGGGGTPQWIQVTFSPGISYTSSVKVERQNGNPSGYTVSMNGGTPITSSFQAYTTVATGSGTLTSIRVQNNGSTNTTGISRIEVDGKVLVDKGVIPVGSYNSSSYLSNAVYSNDLTSSSGGVSQPEQAFDANLSTRATNTVSADVYRTLTWAPSPAINFSSKFEVYCDQGGSIPSASWNGNTVNPGGGQWVTIYEGSGTISSTYPLVINTLSAAQWATLKAVRLDGKILVDSNITPPNLPSIATTCRANPTAGMSISSFQGNATIGATIAHGLGTNVDLYFIKNRSTASNWAVLGHALNEAQGGSNKYLVLNSNGAAGNAGQSPGDSSTLELYNDATNNANGNNYIVYSFSSVEQFSKFGSFTANANADGPFVYLGFRPALVATKKVSGTSTWFVLDSARDPDNVTHNFFEWDNSNAEVSSSYGRLDFLSNGFKVRAPGAYTPNENSGDVYLYMAWAENPFKTARAR